MQETVGKECASLDEIAAELVRMHGPCGPRPSRAVPEAPRGVPPVRPTGFIVELGAGWAGPLHELADAMRVWIAGPEVAAGVLLSWLWFVEFEVEDAPECRDLVRGMRVLKGAVMAAGIEAVGVRRSNVGLGPD